jgi:hypothetical protein
MQNLHRWARLVDRSAMKECSAALLGVAKMRNTSTSKSRTPAPGTTIENKHANTQLETKTLRCVRRLARHSKLACNADARLKSPQTAPMNVDPIVEIPAVLPSYTTSNVFIIGATGPLSKAINGAFICTKKSDGSAVSYMKRNDTGICIEYQHGFWQIKRESTKGQLTCWAYVKGGCELAECNPRKWRVLKQRSTEQESVIVLTGEQANRLVSVPCIYPID